MKAKETFTPVQRFWLLLKPNKQEIRQVYAFAIINGLVALSLPLGIQSIINLIQGGQVSTSWILLVVLVLLGIVFGGILQIMQLRITENLQQSIFTKAAFEFTYRIPKVKLKELYNDYAPELMNRFFGIPIVQKGLSKILIDFSTSVFQIFLGLLLLSLYHPFFIAISIVLVAMSFLIFRLYGKIGLDTSLIESKHKFMVAHWLEEVAKSIKAFKLAGNTNLQYKKTDEYVSNYLNAREQHFEVLKSHYFWMIAFKVVVAGLLLVIGGLLVINQQMNIGQFVAAELIILLILGSVEKLILSLETIYDVLSSLEKVGQVTDMELENENGTEIIDSNKKQAISLELKSVSFSYRPEGKANLSNLSFKVNAGEKIMIAGNNGSGKTTLLNLLVGLEETESGSISYNGLPIANYKLSSLRNSIGTCFTGTSLFHGTLHENISMGKQEIKTEGILLAVEAAGLEENIKQLPKGLDTIVLPDGKIFSQSTIQKINIARALAGKSKFLLIDECINAIERSEREKILNRILSSENSSTVLIVSASSFVANLCDKVLLLENGHLKAFDSFKNIKQELIKITDQNA
jgi:ABC-type bacteriocin/lantibiotic exporter with double-glycine peptidase domain